MACAKDKDGKFKAGTPCASATAKVAAAAKAAAARAKNPNSGSDYANAVAKSKRT